MSRFVSFTVLVGILLAMAALFYKVMANFLLPMFLAVLLVVIFRPFHRWCTRKCGGRDRVAAGLTTAGIVLIVLVPLLAVVYQAAIEAAAVYGKLPNASETVPIESDSVPIEEVAARRLAEYGSRVGLHLSAEDEANVAKTIRERIPAIREKAQEWLGPAALRSVQFTGNFLVGLGVMILSVYYFLADGSWMIRKVMQLSPLDDRYEEQLIEQFAQISRAVVLATLLSAIVQGLLAGIGFWFAGVTALFLLTVLAMLCAMIPFVGAALVWVPVCLWMFFVQDRPMAAIFLAVYCAAIVATADNVIKPLVLHGRSNLHPLLALLSVIGGVQALGPIGILVGPMVVVFLHALLNMLHGELEAMTRVPSSDKPATLPEP